MPLRGRRRGDRLPERALHRLEAVPDEGSGLGRGATADRPGPGEVMIDLAAHHQRFAADGIDEVGCPGGGGIGQNRQRGFQGMSEVAGVAARLFSLRLAMREELVDFLGQRADFGWKGLGNAGRFARADQRDFAANSAQRP
jgi:hypothetical protein